MSKETAKKVLRAGVEVIVTVVSVTVEIVKEALKRRPKQN